MKTGSFYMLLLNKLSRGKKGRNRAFYFLYFHACLTSRKKISIIKIPLLIFMNMLIRCVRELLVTSTVSN